MTDESPLLMVVPRDQRIPPEVSRRLQMELERHRERGGPIVFGFPCNIYRYIDGEWRVLPGMTVDEMEQLQITVEE